MILTADQAKLKIIERVEANISKMVNNFKTLPDDRQSYRYSPSKRLSKLLLKQIMSHSVKRKKEKYIIYNLL